jgi:hypothetical protein
MSSPGHLDFVVNNKQHQQFQRHYLSPPVFKIVSALPVTRLSSADHNSFRQSSIEQAPNHSQPSPTTMSTTMMTLQDKTNDLVGTFSKILESPEPFANDTEKETCQRLVQALPEELVEHAANTSYAYWFLASQPDTCPLEETKMNMAMREARRHLMYMDDNYDKTLVNFTESCQYRKVRRIIGELRRHA